MTCRSDNISDLPDPNAWPRGCHDTASCGDRHRQCMYVGCQHQGRDIAAEIDDARRRAIAFADEAVRNTGGGVPSDAAEREAQMRREMRRPFTWPTDPG